MNKKKYTYPKPPIFYERNKEINNNPTPKFPKVGEFYHVKDLNPYTSWKIVEINSPYCTLITKDKKKFIVELKNLRIKI